ncbi:uncharacterized protein METZ01_LOCUS97253, partial [marine metagenome]
PKSTPILSSVTTLSANTAKAIPGSLPRTVHVKPYLSALPRSRKVKKPESKGFIKRTGPGTKSGFIKARIGTAKRFAPNPKTP